MSIRRKMMVFVSIIVILPMIIILLLSNSIVNNQIEKAAQGYLQNAYIIARDQMVSRLSEMEKLSAKTIKSSEFKEAIEKKNINGLNNILTNINEVYGYINYYMIFDENKRLIANNPTIKNPSLPRLNKLIEKAQSTNSTITSEEVLNLDDLFYADSNEYNKFRVLIKKDENGNSTNVYMTKCITGISVSPVYNKQNNKIIGFLAIGTIANNDCYFPKAYSTLVENSYLAISIDGIRVSSNIQSPKKEDFIGSKIPISVNTLEGKKGAYYGKQNFDGEMHLFLDKPILNCDGDNVGVLGVGIPEKKFSIIMNTQSNIIISVTVLFLIILVFVSRYVASKITEPIIKATDMANEISRGNKEIVIEDRLLENKSSETTILLNAFQKMVDDLKKSEYERTQYLKKLKNEQLEQQKLSQELAALNESLEEKVELRTQGLREAVDSLTKAGKVKSRFLANMSHELRTPLTSIINCSEILKEEIFGTLNDKQHRYINNILNSGNHLLHMINDVLDISKIEAGKMILNLGTYSASEVVMQSINIIKSLAFRKNIQISVEMNPENFMIMVDAKKLNQILCNLLSNSIKFTNEKGKVSLKVIKDDNYMQLTVEDNGIGIKDEDQERIFHEFEQVDNSYEKQYEGTGLGLPLTKKLVEMHGGKIFLSSRFGIGTKVIVTLPINLDYDINNIKVDLGV